jgi:hypothetical protein
VSYNTTWIGVVSKRVTSTEKNRKKQPNKPLSNKPLQKEPELNQSQPVESPPTESGQNESQPNESHLNEPQINESRTSEPQLTESQENEQQLQEPQPIESRPTESRQNESQPNESHLNEPQRNESWTSELQLTESQENEQQQSESQPSESQPNMPLLHKSSTKESQEKTPKQKRGIERDLKGATNMGVPRKRPGKIPTVRCPITGCGTLIGNLKEHLFLTACHENIDIHARNRHLMVAKHQQKLATIASREGNKKGRARYFNQCPLCDQYKANLKPHLLLVRNMTNTQQVHDILRSTTRVKNGSLEKGPSVVMDSVLTRMLEAFDHHLRSHAGAGFTEKTESIRNNC